MKRILLGFFLCFALVIAQAQTTTITANKVVVKDNLTVNGYQITGILNDTTFTTASGQNLPTSIAVKKYVDAAMSGGGVDVEIRPGNPDTICVGGYCVTIAPQDGDKGDIDVSDDGETWLIDTAAVTTSKIATDAVTQAKIANNSVGSGELINKELTPGTYGSATESVRITVDADGRLDSVSVVDISGGLVLTDTFNTALDLTRNAYLLTHTQSDTIRFTVADTTIGRWNAARIASTGIYPLYFDGTGWDASGFFNIVDGGILPLGNHTIYFESTPYGVMVSVPSNYNPESPGSGGFSPLSLPECMLWLDGRDTASIVVSGTTTTWQDKSGNARNASNLISAEQPVKAAGGWVQFNLNDGLAFPEITYPSTQAHTITFVMDPDAVGEYIPISKPTGTYVQLRGNGTVIVANNIFSYQYTSSPQIFQVVYSGSAAIPHAIFVNNVQVATDTELNLRNWSMIGQYGTNPSSFGFGGKMYGVTIHGAALNETERTQLFEFLNTRHGLGL